MPQFSIIVPVYNVQNYLAACVKSVAEQPGPRDWECILVDDGSTDTSGQICDVLAAEIPGLRVLHQQNGGLANARNTGLAAAKGEWVAPRTGRSSGFRLVHRQASGVAARRHPDRTHRPAPAARPL